MTRQHGGTHVVPRFVVLGDLAIEAHSDDPCCSVVPPRSRLELNQVLWKSWTQLVDRFSGQPDEGGPRGAGVRMGWVGPTIPKGLLKPLLHLLNAHLRSTTAG